MGNMLGRRRHAVDEKYTRPQGLYQHRDVDYKKLRKLILNSKLAPCYPGDEECTLDLEECPICFLCYPSLNRSTCCMKAICTECFLRMKQPHSACPTQCPFCKTSNYAVEYRGTRTKEEKGLEEIEEQKVIEAKIRMQQQECQDEEERIQKRQGLCSSSRIVTPGEVECREMPNRSTSVPSFAYAEQGSQFFLPQVPWSLTVNWPPYPRQSRYEDFGPHLEDTMVMETMWHSTQDNGTHRTPASVGFFPSDPSCSQYFYTPHVVAPVEAATSGGLSSAITVLAERQHMCGDITGAVGINDTSLVMLPHSSGLLMREGLVGNYQPEDWIEASPGGGRAVHGGENEWNADPGSEMAEAGTSYTGSNVMFETMAVLPPLDSASMLAGFLLPESFEDQMMMAMAVSVAEARARINTQGLAWL